MSLRADTQLVLGGLLHQRRQLPHKEAAELVLLWSSRHHRQPDGLGHAGHCVEVADGHPGEEVWRGRDESGERNEEGWKLKRERGGKDRENRQIIVSPWKQRPSEFTELHCLHWGHRTPSMFVWLFVTVSLTCVHVHACLNVCCSARSIEKDWSFPWNVGCCTSRPQAKLSHRGRGESLQTCVSNEENIPRI